MLQEKRGKRHSVEKSPENNDDTVMVLDDEPIPKADSAPTAPRLYPEIPREVPSAPPITNTNAGEVFKISLLYDHKWHFIKLQLLILWAASLVSMIPRQANLVLIAYASSEGSGEPAHSRSLARTSAARSYQQWVKRNLQTERQIPGPSDWLGMRGWNLSWRNARRHKFAWRGSFYTQMQQ